MRERFLRNRKLILKYYLGAGIGLFLFWWFARKEMGVDPVILSLLAVYLIVFPIVLVHTRKYAIHIFLFLLTLITGFYSFYHYSLAEHSILNALYFTFQLFLLMVADVFSPDGSILLQYPLIVEIARWSAALYTISTVFIAMYRMLENSILLIVYQLIGHHTIVFGYNEHSLMLIENLRKNKQRVILVSSHLPQEIASYLESIRVAVVHHHDQEENKYTKAAVGRAKRIVILHQEDIDNLNELLDFQNDFTTYRRRNPELIVYIHLHEPQSRPIFAELDKTFNRDGQSFKVEKINVYQTFAQALFEKQTITKKVQAKDVAHFLIIGFGSIGQQIALQAFSELHNLDKTTLQITTLDQFTTNAKQDWLSHLSNVGEPASITLQSFDIKNDSLEAFIREQELPVTGIFICMDDDELDLWAGIELSNKFPQIPIYIEYSEGSFAEKWIQSEASGDRLIYSLGTFQEILTAENLFKQKSR